MADLHERLGDLKQRLDSLRGSLDVESKRARLSEIEAIAQKPDFWTDNQKAQAVLKEKAQYEAQVGEYEGARKGLEDAEVLMQLAEELNDASELESVASMLEAVGQKIGAMEFARMLNGPHDRAACFIDINAGAGGTESMDWAAMLLRMYTRYCERKGWKVELNDYVAGEEAGIKNASLQVDGDFAYGFLKAENGVHRLVRISPYDSAGRRHTSFASVYVYPQIEDDIVIDIPEKDVRIDTYRASGAGGQKVNKTSSAVRITHIPSGIVVAVQNERSQGRNRDTAWKILRSRLYELEMKKRDAEREKVESSKMDIAFGSQIRSYVLAPYRLIKDHRTGVEKGNVDAVLDGELEDFITACLLGVKNPNKPQD
ncbi:MAG: peptide chain release factor 2 [Myxococcales bacterium]